MKSELEIVEEYIDYYGERDFVESLSPEEQALYMCRIRGTISFSFFLIREKLLEFAKIIAKK